MCQISNFLVRFWAEFKWWKRALVAKKSGGPKMLLTVVGSKMKHTAYSTVTSGKRLWLDVWTCMFKKVPLPCSPLETDLLAVVSSSPIGSFIILAFFLCLKLAGHTGEASQKQTSELSPRAWAAFGNKSEGCSCQVEGKREQPQGSSRQEPVLKVMLYLAKCLFIPGELHCWCLVYSFLDFKIFCPSAQVWVCFSQKQSKTKRSAKITTKQCYPHPNKKNGPIMHQKIPSKNGRKINLFVVRSPVRLPGMLQ